MDPRAIKKLTDKQIIKLLQLGGLIADHQQDIKDKCKRYNLPEPDLKNKRIDDFLTSSKAKNRKLYLRLTPNFHPDHNHGDNAQWNIFQNVLGPDGDSSGGNTLALLASEEPEQMAALADYFEGLKNSDPDVVADFYHRMTPPAPALESADPRVKTHIRERRLASEKLVESFEHFLDATEYKPVVKIQSLDVIAASKNISKFHDIKTMYKNQRGWFKNLFFKEKDSRKAMLENIQEAVRKFERKPSRTAKAELEETLRGIKTEISKETNMVGSTLEKICDDFLKQLDAKDAPKPK